MKRLYVLYDDECGFCSRCKKWIAMQSKYLPVAFVAKSSPDVPRRFPGLSPADDLTVVSDDGQVWRGTKAWLMCLYALRAYRPWAFRLARPSLLPLARQAFDIVSHNRHELSRLLELPSDAQIRARIEMRALRACAVKTEARPSHPEALARKLAEARPS